MKGQVRAATKTVMATVLLLMAWTNAAVASQTVAIFPFELLDTSQEEDYMPKVRSEETKRLALLTRDLTARLSQLDAYRIVDVGTLDGEFKAVAPLHKCNGCEVDLIKKSGAQLAILGLVHKFSDTLLSVSIQMLDAQSGVVLHSYSAGIQGNTDEAWLRGVSYIVRNQLVVSTTPHQGTSQ